MKSLKTATILLFVIYLYIGLAFINSVYTFLDINFKHISIKFNDGIAIIGILIILTLISFALIGIKWIYDLHKDMNTLFDHYPISPISSILKTTIPIYNIFGFYRIVKVLFERFRLDNIDLKWMNIKIQDLYVILLGVTTISEILGNNLSDEKLQDFTKNYLLVFGTLWSLCLLLIPVLWYQIVKLITIGISSLCNQRMADENLIPGIKKSNREK